MATVQTDAMVGITELAEARDLIRRHDAIAYEREKGQAVNTVPFGFSGMCGKACDECREARRTIRRRIGGGD